MILYALYGAAIFFPCHSYIWSTTVLHDTLNSSLKYLLCNPTDIDECSDSQLNSCSENATCKNSIGNYSCECNEGYEGNGFNCPGECAIELLQHPYYYLKSKMVEFMLIIHCFFCCFLHLCEQHNERFISSVQSCRC